LAVFYTETFEPFGAYQKTTGRKEVPFSGFANESDKPGPRQKLAKFIRGNFFLPDARKGWNKFAFAKAEELLKIHDFKAVITTGPPHSTHLIGQKLQAKFGVKWLADFRDPWTDIYYYNELYPTPVAKWLDRRMERHVLESADAVAVVSADMKRLFAAKSAKISAEKIAVLPNGFDESDFENWTEPANELFTLLYSGTVTHKYGLQTLFRVADEMAAAGKKIRLIFAGKQDEIVQKQLAALKHVEVVLKGYVSHSEAVKLLLQTDALLLAIPDLPDNKGVLTGKLFEYLAAQRPILCLGPTDGDAAAIILEAQAGVTHDYTDAAAIRHHLENLYQNWEQKTTPTFNAGVVKSFSRKAVANQLAELISRL
jgi:glycosyltransferase involved in cell wall biosynthesis